MRTLDGSGRFRRIAILAGAISIFAGCDSLVHASKEECAQAYDHIVTVHAGDGIGGWLKKQTATALGHLSGDRDELVSGCMGNLTRAHVRCLLRARSEGDLARCR